MIGKSLRTPQLFIPPTVVRNFKKQDEAYGKI
jgi:hypothetical protein